VSVNKETVHAPSSVGGKDLLDIVARNEAITITWLKTYLSFGPEHPLWCFVADELLAKKAVVSDINVDEAMRLNTYLQSWAPYQSAATLKSKDLANMMEVGKRYGVTLDAMAVSRKIQDSMPIWYHKFSNGDRWLFNSPSYVIKCLKEKHRVKYVRDARMLARKIGTPGHKHEFDCQCSSCRVSRAITKCLHPSKCYHKAREMLNSLECKWDPRLMQPEDYEDYQKPAGQDESGAADFDSRITTNGTLGDAFRIFTDGYANLAPTAPDTSFSLNPAPELTVYTDGSAIDNETDNVKAGAGVYFGEDDPRNMAIRVPRALGPSNQVGEMLAIKEAIEAAPPDAPLKIFSDSKYAVDGLTKNLQRWQDEGFHTIANGDIIALTVAKIRERKAPTKLAWVKGHSGVAGNEGADKLAGEGSRKPVEDDINIEAFATLTIPGAKLKAMTQAKAYKIIRKLTMEKASYRELLDRNATRTNIGIAKAAAASTNGETPPAKKFWKSTRDKEISRSIRFFLWMLIHGGYKVGHFWDNIPSCIQRGRCTKCGVHESMEHILTQCEEPGQKEVWDLASEMWQLKTGKDLRPTLGQIMAGGVTKHGDPGKTRLHKILITESAHLIWRIRNERVIQQNGPAPITMIRNRWLKAINNRLAIDCLMTDKFKYEKKAIKTSLVKDTWKKTLKEEHTLARDWPSKVGVLVGVG
jgi:ribonuclease HI